jgi:methylenetetrahydrofolate dehydrogenase (NADP+)/methenyltetrahydrofolate cyclohydrolase
MGCVSFYETLFDEKVWVGRERQHAMRSSPLLLDGRSVAQKWLVQLEPLSAFFTREKGRPPGLAVVRVGYDPASLVYIGKKAQQAAALGIHFEEHILEGSQAPGSLQHKLEALNNAPHIDGVILQLPLPPEVERLAPFETLISHLSPEKDVDGLHPLNRGLLYSPAPPCFVPCTPLGCLKLLKAYGFSVHGREVVVMGRSVLVGRPLAALVLRENGTVTLVHSHTPHCGDITRRADFLFVAMGRPGAVTKDFLKPGAVVVDIGINVEATGCLRGDVDPQALLEAGVRAFSPVPGGVGPLTVMGLMHNTLKAAFQRGQLAFPGLD